VFRTGNSSAKTVASVGITASQVITVVQAAFAGASRGANAYRGTVFGALSALSRCMRVTAFQLYLWHGMA
jgi:hypothetical protein